MLRFFNAVNETCGCSYSPPESKLIYLDWWVPLLRGDGFLMPLFRVRVVGNSNSCSGIFTRAFFAFSSLASFFSGSLISPAHLDTHILIHIIAVDRSKWKLLFSFQTPLPYFHPFNAASSSPTVIRGVHCRPFLLWVGFIFFILQRKTVNMNYSMTWFYQSRIVWIAIPCQVLLVLNCHWKNIMMKYCLTTKFQ